MSRSRPVRRQPATACSGADRRRRHRTDDVSVQPDRHRDAGRHRRSRRRPRLRDTCTSVRPTQLGVTLRNTGTTDTTVTSVTAPAAPFGATPPQVGFVLPAQQSVTVTCSSRRRRRGPASGALDIATSTGSVHVTLSGRGRAKMRPRCRPGCARLRQRRPGFDRRRRPGRGEHRNHDDHRDQGSTAGRRRSHVTAPLAEGQRISPGDSLTVTSTSPRTTALRGDTTTTRSRGDTGWAHGR